MLGRDEVSVEPVREEPAARDACVGLIAWEWNRMPYPWLHRGFDTLIAASVVACFALYRVEPYVAKKRRDGKLRLPFLKFSRLRRTRDAKSQ